jgi:hypothetical protein
MQFWQMRKSKSIAKPSLLTQKQLSAAIGVDANQLRRESSRPGFPIRKVKGQKRYVAEDVIAWRAQNIRHRSTATPASAGISDARSIPTKDNPLATADDPFIQTLMSGRASAIDITRAAMQMASRRVGRAAVGGTLGANDLDGLKKTLQELRAAEASYIELETAKRGLIPRAEVLAIVGAAVGRLVRVASILENAISTEFSIWLGDPKVRDLPTDARARKVREFVAKTTADVRRMEADGVEHMIRKDLS